MTPKNRSRARAATAPVPGLALPFALVAALTLAPGRPARAQTPPLDTTIDTQLFQPAMGPRNFITVESPASPTTSAWASTSR